MENLSEMIHLRLDFLFFSKIWPAVRKRDNDNFPSMLDGTDIVSSATFHPSWPLLLSSSGQRKFRLRDTSAFADSSSSSSDSDSDHDEDIAPNTAADGSPPLLPRSFDSVDNSLRVWHLPCTWTWQEDGSMPLEPQAVSLADEQPVQEPAVDGRSLEEVKADLLNRMGDVDGQRMGVVEQEVVVEGSVADVAME